MSHRRWGVVGAIAAGALLLGACGTDHPATATDRGAAPAPAPANAASAAVSSGSATVTAVDNSFKAETVTVTAGTTVTWTNAGRNNHNVKPVEAADYGVDTAAFLPGTTYSATFSTPGTYHYYCTIHGTKDRGMIGTVEVTP
jgi:plastocyanin